MCIRPGITIDLDKLTFEELVQLFSHQILKGSLEPANNRSFAGVRYVTKAFSSDAGMRQWLQHLQDSY
jgi:hypothetical protein